MQRVLFIEVGKQFLTGLRDQKLDEEFGAVKVLRRFDDAYSRDVHDCAHAAFLLVRHECSDWSRWMGRQVAIDVIMVDDAERNLPLSDGLHNLRTLLVDLSAGIVLEPLQELLGLGVAIGGADYRYPGLQVFAAGIRNGDLVLPLGIGEVE